MVKFKAGQIVQQFNYKIFNLTLVVALELELVIDGLFDI